jgi:hypothetical protein
MFRQRQAEADLRPLPAGQAADRPGCRDVQRGQPVLGGCRVPVPVQPREDPYVIANGQPTVQRDVLGQVADGIQELSILAWPAAQYGYLAAFAAIVSYPHIYDLGRAHGQAGTAARLLPLSVDGLIVAASLVMLLEARAGRAAPPLARVMLGLGVAATIAANIAFGAAYGLTGAAISAWPAVAFIGAADSSSPASGVPSLYPRLLPPR